MVKIANSSPIIAQPVYTIDPATGLPSSSNSSSASVPTGPAGAPNNSVVTVQGITNATPIIVGGNIASGTTDSGNPIKVGGVASSTIPTPVTNGQRVNDWRGVNGQTVATLVDANGNGLIGTVLADGITSSNGLIVGRAYNEVFNGTTWDRQRGDTSGSWVSSSQYSTESTTALAANATVNGNPRAGGGVAGGVGSRFGYFTGQVYVNAAGGTLYVDMSVDGAVTWKQVGSQASVANTCVSLKVPIQATNYRVRFVNGANAVSDIVLTSAYSTS